MTKQRLFEIIEHSKKHDAAGAIFIAFIVTLISINAVAVIVESFDTISTKYAVALKVFEYFSVCIFTIEYILRLWTADCKFGGSGKGHPYIKYIFSFLAFIDFFAIFPFYLTLLIGTNIGSMRVLRLFRLLRILKIARYNDSLNIIIKVMKIEKSKISMTVFIIGIMILIASSIMYTIENAYQPEHFSNILSTVWWAVGTFTGNADIFPVTTAGRLLSGVIGILGIGLVALPSGIISSGFMKEIEDEKVKIKHLYYYGKKSINRKKIHNRRVRKSK